MSEGPPNKRPKSDKVHLLLGTLTKAEYLSLRKEWDEILDADGFNDIERMGNNGSSYLNDWGTQETTGLRIGRLSVGIFHTTSVHIVCSSVDAYTVNDAKRTYFARCSQFLESASRRRPKGQLHRSVWRLHSEGATVRAIAEEVGADKMTVHRIIKKYDLLMQLWWDDTAASREAELDSRTEEKEEGETL